MDFFSLLDHVIGTRTPAIIEAVMFQEEWTVRASRQFGDQQADTGDDTLPGMRPSLKRLTMGFHGTL